MNPEKKSAAETKAKVGKNTPIPAEAKKDRLKPFKLPHEIAVMVTENRDEITKLSKENESLSQTVQQLKNKIANNNMQLHSLDHQALGIMQGALKAAGRDDVKNWSFDPETWILKHNPKK